MNEPWHTVLRVALVAWAGALAVGIPWLLKRPNRVRAAAFDLVGAWAGALAAGALAIGRAGFLAGWAALLTMIALMVTASLYDRAVIMPSLEAARARTQVHDKWARDERYLWRMSHGTRILTLLLAAASLWIGWQL